MFFALPGRRRARSLGRRGLAFGLACGLASEPAAAHTGTTHAGTPHWLLFVMALGGLAVLGATLVVARRRRLPSAVVATLVASGALSTVLGGIGLVELQVVAQQAPELVSIYPAASLAVAGLLAVGGFAGVALKWPEKPQYAALCLVLAGWILYPTVMPNQGYRHPLGYLVVVSLPVLLGAIVWTDARALVQSVRRDPRARAVGIVAGLLTAVFFAFSAGTVSLNPDQGYRGLSEAFVVPYHVADPLVVWPAVEFYLPSVPFSGYVSVGSLLLMGVLGGLVGLNAAVVVQQWRATDSADVAGLFTGSLAASGATACCCCAPALYGALSVAFGGAVTPVYWSFMLPSSPVGATFLAVSVLLLVGSLLASTGGPRTVTA